MGDKMTSTEHIDSTPTCVDEERKVNHGEPQPYSRQEERGLLRKFDWNVLSLYPPNYFGLTAGQCSCSHFRIWIEAISATPMSQGCPKISSYLQVSINGF